MINVHSDYISHIVAILSPFVIFWGKNKITTKTCSKLLLPPREYMIEDY